MNETTNGSVEWESAAKLAEKYANQGGIFLRLANDGDKAVGVFCGAPFTREVVWTGDRYETYDPAAHEGRRPTLRVLLNFYVPSEGAMKVIEGGTVWFKDVLKVRGKYGLDKWSFELERHGASGDPKTTYSILPEERVTPELQAAIARAGLHDLAAVSAGQEGAPGGQAADVGDGAPRAAAADRPVDEATAQEFASALRQLPKADVERFFARYGLKRVRDLRESQLEDARSALASMVSDAFDPF